MNNTNYIIKKILIVVLCICLLTSAVMMVSCTEETTDNTSSASHQSGQSTSSAKDPEGAFLDGETEYIDELLLSKVHHDINYTKTSDNVYANGKSDYVVVLPENYSSTINTAKSELVSFFREATGDFSLTTSVDTDLVYSASKKYISLGKTSVAAQAGVTMDGVSLKTNGFMIKTVGKSIFIIGEDTGVVMGVYKLLNIWFDFDQMNSTYYDLRHNVQTVPLYNFNITDVPDIDYRLPPYGAAYNNLSLCRRMCMTSDKDLFIKGANAHSMLRTIVPYYEYRNSHPKWFLRTSTDDAENNQLCYTAHGDAEEYAQMVDCAVEHMKELIRNDPQHSIASMTQMDTNIWCTCESCSALREKYDTDAVSQIRFINDVVARLKTWLKGEMNGREVEFVIFSYHKTQKAPTIKNEEGKWVPIDDTVIMKDVSIWVAPISLNFVNSVFSSNNREMLDAFESWLPVAPKLLFWGYDCHFRNYLVPLDTYRSMQDMIKEAVRCNASMFWAQGSWDLLNSTNFDNVKSYVYSKLMWNCMLNINDIIHDYFVKTYRAAADTMEAAYWAMRSMFIEQEANGVSDNTNVNTISSDIWPSRYLFGQLELFEKAKSELDVYRESDPEFYSVATEQVQLESIGPRYLIICLYPSAFSEYEFDAFFDEFSIDVSKLKINKIAEATNISSFLEKYGK